MLKTITSMEEYDREYFPKHYKEKLIKNMTPEEAGRYMAKKSIDKIRMYLED